MSDGYVSPIPEVWQREICAALGLRPGHRYTLAGAVEQIEELVAQVSAKSSLPEPDATNPDHVSFAAEIVGKTHPKAGYRAELNDIARRLDANQAAEREREQRIEAAARVIADENEIPAHPRDIARALDAAGLLRGGGRGE